MKFEVKKIVRPIELGDYAAEYAGGQILVWVNIPQKMIDRHDAVRGNVEEFLEVMQELWSQGPEQTRFSLDEVQEMHKGLMDKDPQMWMWIVRQTDELVVQHRTGLKKG